ncbi:hypothetical protein AX15_004428 [Amanita polypyramis BW_CC]|nr:hypothetical protein AX15_004428 [Amanita polypyramis BW_CC]
MAQKFLVNLPVELICLILSYLDVSDLVDCAILSRHFRTIIHNSSQMQYAIELAKHRLICVTPPSQRPSYARRLQVLREREYAWCHMRWKGRYKLKLPFAGSVYDFSGGIYGNGGDETDGTTASISFLKLPSVGEESHYDQAPKPRLWTHVMSDMLIFDFTMDPSQDLLVLLALASPSSKSIYELHLRTLSTNEPHPQALSSKIPCIPGSYQNVPLSDLNPAVTIQVVGDLVAVLFKELVLEHGAHLEIWNWKLGPKYSSTMHRIAGIDDFTFLNEESFLLVRPSERLEVYKFVPPTDCSSTPQCVVSLELPPLSSQYRYWYITMSSNPVPGHVPRFPNPSSTKSDPNPRNINVKCSCSEQLYYPNPHERVLACCLYIFDITQPQDNSVRSFVFFVNIDTFLKPPEYWLSMMPERFFKTPLNQGIYRYTLLDLENGELYFIADHNEPSDTHGQGSDAHYTASDDDQRTNDLHISDLVDAQNSQAREIVNVSSSVYSMTCPRRWHLPPGSYPSIPWEVWGPQSTRWFNGNWRTDWQHATYGLRTVDSVRVRRSDTPSGECKAKAKPFKKEDIDEPITGLWQDVDNDSESSSEEELDEEIDNFDGEDDEAEILSDGPGPLRVLRVRDYNPHSVALSSKLLRSSVVKEEAEANPSLLTNGKGKGKALEHSRIRVVTGPSITPVHGVYKEDIKSSLPFVEVLSKEKFDVTDVMLDDRRLLLLKVCSLVPLLCTGLM